MVRYLALIAVFFVSCKTTPTSETKGLKDKLKGKVPNYSNAKSLGLNEEYIPANEAMFLKKSVQSFRKIHMEQQNTNRQYSSNNLRGMHAKGHACYKATLTSVTQNTNLLKGVFREEESLDAVVRFSNGSGLIQPDQEKDLRGLAIKVYDSSIPSNENSRQGEQDFLMTNAPVHHAKDIVELMGFIEAMAAGGAKKVAFLGTHPRLTKTLLSQTGRKVDSLLNESYWSRAAFTWGERRTARYHVEPCQRVTSLKFTGNNFLTEELQQQMRNRRGFCYNFYLKMQTDPTKEPIEDHSVLWQSKSLHVAQLNIQGGEPLDAEECHRLVFNPWNHHPDHKPLGNFNRARKLIYNAAEKFRNLK